MKLRAITRPGPLTWSAMTVAAPTALICAAGSLIVLSAPADVQLREQRLLLWSGMGAVALAVAVSLWGRWLSRIADLAGAAAALLGPLALLGALAWTVVAVNQQGERLDRAATRWIIGQITTEQDAALHRSGSYTGQVQPAADRPPVSSSRAARLWDATTVEVLDGGRAWRAVIDGTIVTHRAGQPSPLADGAQIIR